MVYSQLSERLTDRADDHLLKMSGGGPCGSPSPVYQDMWRQQSPGKFEPPCRPPLELSVNPYGPSYDMEGVPNVLFSPCPPPTYKEFAVFKEKPIHDVGDTYLSLKNPVVHPQFTGQLSPISPAMHLGPMTPVVPGPPNGQGQPLTYTVNHSAQLHPVGYSGRSSPAYPSVHAQFHGDHISAQQQGMFPAMSVNVSMSMNVVPPNFANNQYNQNQQWQTTPPQHHSMGQDYPHSPQGSFQPQYSPYSPSYHYPQPYSLSSDFRSAVSDNRSFHYRATTDEYRTNTRYYSPNAFKRSKFMDESPVHMPHSPDSAKINLCRICGKTYARPSTLKTHLRTHSGEKPYKCSSCSKSFSQAANLTAHLRTHSGEKPFHCPVCDRHFSQSSSVTTHMRTHSGERPYRCRLCKKAFSDSSTLTKHLRIHSGEKPYQCKLCLLRFSQSGNLNRHMRVHSNAG